jgi:branched-chain amino acid transport system substrate-binding protein
MRLQQQWWSVLVAAVLGGLMSVTAVAAAGAQFVPLLGHREGALKTLGISFGNGYIDYLTLLNERDGGINGVPLVGEECETVYDIDRGMECYERLKAQEPTGQRSCIPSVPRSPMPAEGCRLDMHYRCEF